MVKFDRRLLKFQRTIKYPIFKTETSKHEKAGGGNQETSKKWIESGDDGHKISDRNFMEKASFTNDQNIASCFTCWSNK